MFKTKPRSPSQQKGLYFEKLALTYLKKQGLVLLEQNYHCRFGEIDLVMRDNAAVVFIEVRFREKSEFGFAFDTVDKRKQQKLIKTAQLYLLQHELYEQVSSRFDVISATIQQNKPKLQWIRNAFQV